MDIVVERCDPLTRADEIKRLFVRNERPDFPGHFDLAYPASATAGGSSWVALDNAGRVVGHITAFPRTFRQTTRTARAALLGDLMMDLEYRDLWSPLQLCRRAVSDLRDCGTFDFVYTQALPPAYNVLRAAGLREVGALGRFVMPLPWLYREFFRLKGRAEPLATERLSEAWEPQVADVLRGLPASPYFRGDRGVESYRPRLGRGSILEWEWLVLRTSRQPGSRIAGVALLAGNARTRRLTMLDLLWDAEAVSLPSVLHGVASAAAVRGFTRVDFRTLVPSRFAQLVVRCGFIARRDRIPLLVLPLAAVDALPDINDWTLTHFDGSAW